MLPWIISAAAGQAQSIHRAALNCPIAVNRYQML